MNKDKCKYYQGVWVAPNARLFTMLEEMEAEKNDDVKKAMAKRCAAQHEVAMKEFRKHYPNFKAFP